MADLFASEPATTQELLGSARRELAMRQRVYPRLTASGKMADDTAQRELGLQRELVRLLEFMVAEKFSIQAVYGRLRNG